MRVKKLTILFLISCISLFPVFSINVSSSNTDPLEINLVKIFDTPKILDKTEFDQKYQSYFGGSNDEHGNCIIQDSEGNIIIAGLTHSSDFPTTIGAYDRTFNGGSDIFVSKWTNDGSNLIFSTFLGGSKNDSFVGSAGIHYHALEINLDSQDNILIYGTTSSEDFPVTAGALNVTFNGGEDLFITKLAKNGSNLIFSTFFGGSGMDFINLGNNRLVLDPSDNIYITGVTKSVDFPISTNAYGKTKNANNDAFISKISSDGSTLHHSTFLMVGTNDYGFGLAIDSEMKLIVGGTSDNDVFVLKFSTDLLSKIFSIYLSGNSWEQITGLIIDKSNDIYLLGCTGSSDFPTTEDGYDRTYAGNYDTFISKIKADGSSIIATTFIGGTEGDYPSGFVLSDDDTIQLVGYTSSTDFPVTNDAFDKSLNGNSDYFFVLISSNLSFVEYSTFIGGSSTDDHGENWNANGHDAGEIITDQSGNFSYIIGSTRSSDLSVTNEALNKTLNGGSDLFLNIFKKSIDILSTDTSTSKTSTSSLTNSTVNGEITSGYLVIPFLTSIIFLSLLEIFRDNKKNK